jgi:hypothetical protein
MKFAELSHYWRLHLCHFEFVVITDMKMAMFQAYDMTAVLQEHKSVNMIKLCLLIHLREMFGFCVVKCFWNEKTTACPIKLCTL